jgi:subtilisin family serine protease
MAEPIARLAQATPGALDTPTAPEVSAPGLVSTVSASAAALQQRLIDLVDFRRNPYVVFAEPTAAPTLQAPKTKGPLRGTSPTGEPWTTARLTSGEMHDLQQRGVRVLDDYEITVPTSAPATPNAPIEADNLLARDVHEVTELNALGPAFEGEGGLFISVDSGVARHRDLPPTVHFDNVYTDALEDEQADGGRHGTHTSGSAVARGNPETGGTRGMAPRAQLAGVQVLDERGRGNLSSVLRGIERAVDFAREHDGFVVVNMSLGSPARGNPADDPMVQAIERAAREHGILFTISAGNRGPGEGTIGTPGVTPLAITVGAMDHNGTLDPADDKVARFSSRDVPGGLKPTLVARGVNVRSTIPGDGYAIFNGTSMATPITGGAALALGQGLLDMYRRGQLRVDPRELVKTGEYQRLIAEATLDNPAVPANIEGAGDLRIMRAYRLITQLYGTSTTTGPAPYIPPPRTVPADARQANLRYTPPF